MDSKVLLSEICDIKAGGTPSRRKKEYWNGNIQWLKISDIKSKYISETTETITEQGVEKSSTKVFDKNTIVYTIFATLGEVAILNKSMATNQAIAGLKILDDSKVCIDYLYYYLKSIKNDIIDKGRGVAQNNINLSILKNIKIPLQSLEKQKEIAKTLDKASELIELRKESIKKLDELSKSIFIDMFGDNNENPKNWERTTLVKLGVTLEGGKNIAESPSDENIQNYILKISSVTSGVFNTDKVKPLPNDYEVPSNHFVKQGDLLMTRANTSLLVGATAYVKEEHKNLVLPDKIWRFVFPENIALNKIFYWKLFQTDSIRNEISKRATGTSGSMKNISKPKTLSIPIILPPMELQNKFTNIVEKIEEQKALYEEELEKLQYNFDALLAKSFES